MALRRFSGIGVLAQALAERTAALLDQAVSRRGHAMLALSGGSTPRQYLPPLGKSFHYWNDVDVRLIDDRWVPSDHPDSNEGMVRALLPQARLTGLVNDAGDPQAGLAAVKRSLQSCAEPWDVALLGMGPDGHVASLFPGTGALEDPDPFCTAVMTAPLHPRISLSATALRRFRHPLLIITGEEKLAVLERAEADGLPAALLLERGEALEIFWAP
ncbi:MAG TPA: 6-phosphogluconolactonase [Candidatus Sulfotelmatobacter sp.]|jgi:6-phosphogluconolactonase|nr:6-phosphogluconolactonase [Candidatus Sulfotelmatobacter sp.]